jgi:hypothetical protein
MKTDRLVVFGAECVVGWSVLDGQSSHILASAGRCALWAHASAAGAGRVGGTPPCMRGWCGWGWSRAEQCVTASWWVCYIVLSTSHATEAGEDGAQHVCAGAVEGRRCRAPAGGNVVQCGASAHVPLPAPCSSWYGAAHASTHQLAAPPHFRHPSLVWCVTGARSSAGARHAMSSAVSGHPLSVAVSAKHNTRKHQAGKHTHARQAGRQYTPWHLLSRPL